MNIIKRSMAMFLVLCMLVGLVPMNVFADETDSTNTTVTESLEEIEETTEEVTGEETEETTEEVTEEATEEVIEEVVEEVTEEVTEPVEKIIEVTEVIKTEAKNAGVQTTELTYAEDYRILHLDCGRKYFSVDWIKALINEMAAAGYTHLELAFGNDGLRFLLDDMSVGTYTDEQVTAAVQQGNKDYNSKVSSESGIFYDPTVNELTQSEMDAIILHAKSKGIQIIPLLNNPGHMNAVVSAISSLTNGDAGYNGSSSTIDLENPDAVEFTKELLQKYITYFKNNGCNEFNFGADEYANDIYSTGSMGFGALVYAEKYPLFVNYVNKVAAIIKNAGMVPIAFNDGIYFNKNTSYSFDTQIMVAFWTSGWSGYQSADASTMEDKGHKMINVHGGYYYVSGKDDKWTTGETTAHDSSLYTEASDWNNNTFMGSTVDNPAGSMFCIWCDYPGFETETQIAQNVRMILRAMAAEMQGNDANSVSDEVVSGGFNVDGTVAETREWVEVWDETNCNIQVGGYELTHASAVKVPENEIPVVEDTAKVLAWDITPYVEDTAYNEPGTVNIPIPEGWNTAMLTGFYVENDKAVLVKGQYLNGYYKFNMPHFSVAGIAEKQFDKLIELNENESKTELIQNVDLTNNSYNPDPANIATVTTAVHNVAGNKVLVPVKSGDDIVSGAKYVLMNKRSGNILGNTVGYASTWGTNCLEQSKEAASVNSPYWIITESETGYVLKTEAGSCMVIGSDSSDLKPYETVLNITDYKNGTFAIGQYVYDDYYGYYYDSYLNDMGAGGEYAGGYWDFNDAGAPWYLYRIDETQTSNGTNVTFTGNSAGVTYVTINDVVNKIVLHRKVDITIKYVDENGKEIVSDTVQVNDSDTTYTLSNFNYGGKFYTIENKILDITPNTVKEYTVTVTETEENLDNVTPLTIEYWQTNSRVNAPEKESANQMSVAASDAYSEAGLTLIDIIPATGYRAGNPVVYWRSRLLTNDERQESGDGSYDCTWSGIGFTKVRYWNGSWAVFTDDNVWQNVVLDNNQLVAYYMNDLHLADEVKVGTSDWAKKGNVQPDASSEGFVSIVFQVVYEGGTSSPADVTTDMVGDYSYLVNAWRSAGQVQRGVGTIALTKVGNYEICKVTATTGTHTLKSNNTIESIAWLNNERVLFEDEEHPVSQYTIHNPSQPENVIKDEEHENLYWDENNESILIRIYVKAVETEDSLKVVYYDEKFGDTLTGYNIIVPNGSDFNNGIVKADTTISATLPAFGNSNTRKNANGYGIVNSLKKTQNFTTDLTQVPNVMGKYNSALYVYNGSEISEDGTTLTHYYTINTEIFSPNFVADFGLPLTFQLSQIIGEGQDKLVDEVTVNQKTRYGTLSYDDENKVFTYTPTRILQGIDVLTINILFKYQTSATTTNVGVTPATTVYYEESFVEWGTGWTGGKEAITVENQAAEEIGDYQNNNNFGYDDAYADVYTNGTGASNGTNATTATIGEKGTFTFAGTGIQVFANCTKESGYVAVEVRDSNGKAVKLSMVDTAVSAGTTSATAGQQGSMYGLPVVSLVDLKNMKHDTYTVNIIKIMDDEPVSIDGIRVFNTIEDSTIFKADLEDNPKFYELRDMVLYALKVDDDMSGKYGSLGEMATQVYDEVVAQTANNATTDKVTAVITSPTGIYGDGATVQDLLDNGPKNELYLYKEQTLTFKVKTNRLMQLGLKAPKGSTNYTFVVNYENGTITESVANKTLDISTSVDMFYSLGNKNGTERTYTVTVTNNGDNILSVTLLKICDDPNASFEALTAKDMEYTLTAMGYTFPKEETKNPSKPSSPETTVVPEDTKEDESPSVPTEIVKVEVADSEETSKVVQKENNATSSVEDEASKSEEVTEPGTTVEEDDVSETKTDIQENENLENEKAEKSSSNPILVISIAIAILAVITVAIFGFKKNKKK